MGRRLAARVIVDDYCGVYGLWVLKRFERVIFRNGEIIGRKLIKSGSGLI